MASWIVEIIGLFLLVPAFGAAGFAALAEETGDASNVCEGYTQQFETGDDVNGHVEPPVDTADWYGFDISASDVTAPDGGNPLAINATPQHARFFDQDADFQYDAGEPVYLMRGVGSIQIGDVRLTAAFGYVVGTKVVAGNADHMMPTNGMPGASAILDYDGDAQWSYGDAFYWDADASHSVTVGDVRLSDQATFPAGTIVNSGNSDLNNSLLPWTSGQSAYHDVGPAGYDVGDPVYADLKNTGRVGGLDIRISGPQYGSIVVVQTIYLVLEETASGQPHYKLDLDAREVEQEPAGRHCGESVVGAPDGKQITAKLGTQKCDGTKWSFIINQIRMGASAAPPSIHVRWSNGFTADVALEKFTGKVAHYSTSLNLVSPVTFASTYIYEEWSGNFNLERGPCFRAGTDLWAKAPAATHIPSDCAQNAQKSSGGAFNVISFQATQPCTFSVGVRLIQSAPLAADNRAASGFVVETCHDGGCVLYSLGFGLEREEGRPCDCYPPTF
jgi:hypothetical protein